MRIDFVVTGGSATAFRTDRPVQGMHVDYNPLYPGQDDGADWAQ